MVAQEQMSQILLKSAKKQRSSTIKKFLITLSDFMQKPYQLNINLHKINIKLVSYLHYGSIHGHT